MGPRRLIHSITPVARRYHSIVLANVRSSNRKPEIALLSTFRIGDFTNAKKIPESVNAPHDAIPLRQTSDYLQRLYPTFRLGSISSVTLFGHRRAK